MPPLPYYSNYGDISRYGTPWFSNPNAYIFLAYTGQSFIPPPDYYFVPLPGGNRRGPWSKEINDS